MEQNQSDDDKINIFGSMNLKPQFSQEVLNECDRSIELVNNIQNDLVTYMKVSNGILGTLNKKVTLNPPKSKYHSKRTFLSQYSRKPSYNNLKCSPSPSSKFKVSQLFPTSLEEMRETVRENDIDGEGLKKVITNSKSRNLPQIVKKIQTHDLKREMSFASSTRDDKTPSKVRTNRSRNITNHSKQTKSQVTGRKSYDCIWTTTESDVKEPPKEELPRDDTLPNIEKVNKILQEFNKVPQKNVRKRFSKIYNEFDGISTSNKQLSANIEKSYAQYYRNMELLHHREKVEQNKVFGKLEARERLFVYDGRDQKKEVFDFKLNKKSVLKDYQLINVLKDTRCKDLMNKYLVEEGKIGPAHKKKNPKHQKVIEILESMQYLRK
jgi:hypothetical protein